MSNRSNNNNNSNNSKPTANLQSKVNAYPAYEDRHGNVQQSIQRPQKMQGPAKMQRPAPLDVSAALARRQEQERRKIVRSLPPMWAEIPVGSSELPCVMGRTGLLLTQESVGWLEQERRHDIVPVAVTPAVTAAAPVATPVAAPVAKPSYRKDSGRAKRKDSGRAKRKARLVEVDVPWLDPKEASRALVESMAWIDRSNAKWTATKAQLARVGMIKSAKEPTPAGLLAGPGLSFKAEHELLRRRHVVAEVEWSAVEMEGDGGFLILSREAMADPRSPWRTRINIEELAEAAAKEAAEELAGLKQAHEVRRALVRLDTLLAAEIRAKAQASVDEELRREAEEAALLAKAEDNAMYAAISDGGTPKAQQAAYDHLMAEWKKARAISRVKARMAELEKSKAAAKPDLVEEARADRATYPSYDKFRASRISGSRDSKPVHKGQAKVVAKKDVGVIADPNMVGKVAFDKAANRPYVSAAAGRVLDYVEAVMDKRQVADLIGPKVVARRVR